MARDAETALWETRSSILSQLLLGQSFKGIKLFFPFHENFSCLVLAMEEMCCCGNNWFCMDLGGEGWEPLLPTLDVVVPHPQPQVGFEVLSTHRTLICSPDVRSWQ